MRVYPENVLFVGNSGGGKTFGAAQLALALGYEIKLIRGSRREYEKYLPNLKIEETGWDDDDLFAAQSRKVTYIIEDVHALSAPQKEKVCKLMNFVSRHMDCAVIVIAHAVRSNGLYGLLDFLTKVYVTSDKINLRSVKILLKHYFFPSPGEAEETFLNIPHRHYFFLDVKMRRFDVLDPQLVSPASREQPPPGIQPQDREKILKFFQHLPNNSFFPPLYDFLTANMDTSKVAPVDYSIKLKSKKGKFYTVSLIDYMYFLQNSDERPPKPVRMLHRFLKKDVCFPTILIKNQHLG